MYVYIHIYFYVYIHICFNVCDVGCRRGSDGTGGGRILSAYKY